MQKLLFIDRDGTLILEPQDDFQIDSLEKLEFVPHVITFLRKIVEELDYKLVIVSNQDGLGTKSFPEENFEIVQQKMMTTFKNEGIFFYKTHFDRTFEHENASTRKPRIGMLTPYFTDKYNLAESFVIGDRLTDIELAQNIGAKSIYFLPPNRKIHPEIPDNLKESVVLTTHFWEKIYNFLRLPSRKSNVVRNTNETQITIELDIDGTGKSEIQTGIGFFDHMLDQLSRHAGIDLKIKVVGDLHIDEHHTIEDTALALGEAFKKALGQKKGIYRYGFLLPMDDCLAQVAIDFSGRAWLVWEAEFKREKIGEMPTELFFHFFKSFSDKAECNLSIKCEGANEHHKIESIFKGWAKAIHFAVRHNPLLLDQLPSTKGLL